MVSENIKYSLRNLKSSKSRSALTVFSIFVGITTLFIFVSFGLGLYEYIDTLMTESTANKLLVQAKGTGAPGLDDTFKLTDVDIEAIKKVPGVDRVSGAYFKPAEIKQNSKIKYVFATSYDPKEPLVLEFVEMDVVKGRYLRAGDTKKVLLGYNYYPDNTIFPEGYNVGDKINVQGIDLRVVGILESVGNPQDDSNLYVTNDYFEELFPDATSYGMIVVESNEKNLDSVIEKIEKKLRNVRGLEEGKEDFEVQSFQALIESFSGALNIVIAFIILIALVSVLVSAVNTANTMVTSVLERYKEIGVLKAVGARNSEIFKIFLFESSFLGFIAGCIGVLIGFLFAYAGATLLESLGYGFLTPSYSPYIFIGCILFATITGAISGVFPAINASKTNTVDALRYE